ncbi:MAG: hypothetical protein H0T18_02290 [Chloroflexia bacterium]|nr:hypothetical protein [Chloroflexia bacterium]
MSAEPVSRMDAAIAEIKELILTHFTGATFDVGLSDDPDGTSMTVTVDVEDTDDVVDVIVERSLEMQVDEGIPLYVVPVRPIERIMADLRAPDPVWKRPLPSFG